MLSTGAECIEAAKKKESDDNTWRARIIVACVLSGLVCIGTILALIYTKRTAYPERSAGSVNGKVTVNGLPKYTTTPPLADNETTLGGSDNHAYLDIPSTESYTIQLGGHPSLSNQNVALRPAGSHVMLSSQNEAPGTGPTKPNSDPVKPSSEQFGRCNTIEEIDSNKPEDSSQLPPHYDDIKL